MKKILLPLVIALCCGCGNYCTVRVPLVMPESDNPAEVKRALSSLYIVVKTPGAAEPSFLGELLGPGGYEAESETLAAAAAKGFVKRGIQVLAYRVADAEGKTEPYLNWFKPSAFLEIKASKPEVTVTEQKSRGKNGEKIVTWAYAYSIRVEARLFAGDRQLDKFVLTPGSRAESSEKIKRVGEWVQEKGKAAAVYAASALVSRYCGKTVWRERVLPALKDDKEYSKACSMAAKGDWGGAEKVWRARGDWRGDVGLASGLEFRKDYAGAKTGYANARKAAQGEKDSGSVSWDGIMADLDIAVSSPTHTETVDSYWFSPKMAVLPFMDETTSIDGPKMVREMMYERLKTAGYNLQSLEETDKILLSHGLTQGGHLGAADKAEICSWLGVGRLFYGDINEFNEIMAGIYNKRTVKGQAYIWDSRIGDFVWTVSTGVTKVASSKSFIGGIISQLGKGLAERIGHKVLAEESLLFTGKVVESLPNAI